MYYQYRKTRKRYTSFAASASCDFCDPDIYKDRALTQTDHAYVIPNRTSYDQWELSKVIEHLMVIPKRHVLHLTELQPDERLDLMNIIAEYEAKGYEIYARSQTNVTRSVPHQHTHLIKTEHKPRRGMLFLQKPYILWLFR